jgi:UDP:flavonoid glycosyltransferase YjiC (YdhE family)
VRVLATSDFHQLIRSAELDFFDMGGSMEAVARSMEGQLEGGNMLRILASMGPAAERMIGQAVARGLEASQGSDVIIAGLGGLPVGCALAEKLGIAFVPAYLYPFTPTSAFSSVLAPRPGLSHPGWANRLSHRVAQQMIWQAIRTADAQARRQVLDLPPASFWGPYAALEASGRPTLCGYSPHVIPVPGDWAPSIHVTGYWFLEPPEDWQPPDGLLDFLHAGPPPVYIGFGSMVNRRPEEVAALVCQALERSGLRAVWSTGWGGLSGTRLPESVFMTGSVPHAWLFPRMAAVVHHGGVGTTAAGLRAGVPSIAIPYFGDQPFWGRRIAELGVGPRPIPRSRLTADRLALALQSATTDTAMQARAARLGESIRAEDGIGNAVRVLEDFLARG